MPTWRQLLVLAAASATVAGAARAQQGPVPVGVTAVRELTFDARLTLTGTVRSQRASVVASEVEGLVDRLVAREGDFVTRGATLAVLRQTNLELDLEATAADLREAEARLDLATQNLERARDLQASGVTSRQDLDAAISEAAAWQGRVDRLRAEIKRARDDLDRSRVPAPFAGFVIREHTQVGEWLDQGSPVVELLDLEEPDVVVEVPERSFAGLAVGAPAVVTFEALPDLRLEARVSAVIPAADPHARTFPVKIRFDNHDHRVGAGMLARVELSIGDAGPGLGIPKDALLQQAGSVSIFRVGADNRLESVEVRLGRARGQWIEVHGSLAAGDLVVTRGNERVRAGQEVQASAVEYPEP